MGRGVPHGRNPGFRHSWGFDNTPVVEGGQEKYSRDILVLISRGRRRAGGGGRAGYVVDQHGPESIAAVQRPQFQQAAFAATQGIWNCAAGQDVRAGSPFFPHVSAFVAWRGQGHFDGG